MPNYFSGDIVHFQANRDEKGVRKGDIWIIQLNRDWGTDEGIGEGGPWGWGGYTTEFILSLGERYKT